MTALTASGARIIQYIPDHAYLVWGSPAQLARFQAASPAPAALLYQRFQPADALHPALDRAQADAQPGAAVDVVVQVVDGIDDTLAAIQKSAIDVLSPPLPGLHTQVVGLRVSSDHLSWLASQPGVVNVEPYPVFHKHDEIQAQIMAGAMAAGGHTPTGPGYLAWLTGLGFSTNPNDYPIVDITDDGLDDGSLIPRHADFYVQGNKSLPDRLIYNEDWTSDPLADGGGGHGNLNAGIALGYNNLTGAPYQDANGYRLGLGINPFGRIGGSKVFGNNGFWQLPGDNYAALVSRTYNLGGRISSNSWGDPSTGAYTTMDQTYDALARDAVSTQPGLQSLIFVFSAGNDGPTPGSTGSPGNAKNVITVGASENVRPTWQDGCLVGPSGADDAQQIIDFSSRGPTRDGRIKPDIVAPGTHIQGAASQSPNYSGEGVCDQYHPSGQTLYAASSGTSHSAPAVAGALSLFYRYYQDHFGLPAPSPAMAKAYLTNSARYLTGPSDTLPSSQQGLGLADLGMMFDGVSRLLVDQEAVLSSTGQVFTLTLRVADPALPLRASLAWTDAPGATVGNSYVNDLNLSLTVNGQTYLGNHFSGAFSTTGGAPDPRNNLESIFLPHGFSGDVVVRVVAANLPGDGLPGNGDPTDQDFALVLYNARAITGYLRGQVSAADTGQPIPTARVGAVGQGRSFHTTVDASGAYTLPLPAGLYTATAWAYGYGLIPATDLVITQDLTVSQSFSLPTAAQYTLQGCLSDLSTLAPLAGEVAVYGPYDVWITHQILTQAEPCYNFQLPSAPYRLVAASRLHLSVESSLNLDADKTQDFALPASTTSGLFSGQVTSARTGQPLPYPSLWFDPDAFRLLGWQDGKFETELPPLPYTLTVSAPLYEPVTDTFTIPQSNLLERQYTLPSAALSITPVLPGPAAPFTVTLYPGQSLTLTWTIANPGAVPLTIHPYQLPGQPGAPITDSFGYARLDSRYDAGVAYAWEDVAGGVQLGLNDDGEASLPLPFPFSLYGSRASYLRIGNNGAMLLTDGSPDISYQNVPLAATSLEYLIAPFWDDLVSTAGWVSYAVLGQAPERRLVVEWYRRPHYYNQGEATLEAVLYEATGNIKFQYQDVYFCADTPDCTENLYDRGKSATVGLRGFGPYANEFSYLTPSLENGMALCFQKPGSPPCDPLQLTWLQLPASPFVVPAGQTRSLSIRLDASNLPLGTYDAQVRLASNDPESQPAVILPIRLIISRYALFFTTIHR